MKEIHIDEEKVKLLVGSHQTIIIDKLYGPAYVKDLVIVWEGDDWNVRKKIDQLRKQLRDLKGRQKIKECKFNPEEVEEK